jgi:biotin operon repressor
MATQFQRNKMKWLNAINYDCALSPMTCRVAFVIADHLNQVSGDAWPSERRISSKLCISTKTVQRSVKELESAGWVDVRRSKGRNISNRYRPRFERLKTTETKGGKSDQKYRQGCPQNEDTGVRQTFLGNPLTTYLEGAGDEKAIFRDQGMYEQQLIRRLGTNGRQLLEHIAAEDPRCLTQLCWAQKRGDLTDALLHGVASRFYLYEEGK